MKVYIMKKVILPLAICLVPFTAFAASSSYSEINFDKHCQFAKQDQKEPSMGASAICTIDDKPIIHFEEGDLRQSLGFGAAKQYESFGPFNNIGKTIEWRAFQGTTFAAITRFHIENSHLGDAKSKAPVGQVLAIHRVALYPNDTTCIIGLVDALANKHANQLARDIADKHTLNFDCLVDLPKYHGKRGKFSADFMKTLPE